MYEELQDKGSNLRQAVKGFVVRIHAVQVLLQCLFVFSQRPVDPRISHGIDWRRSTWSLGNKDEISTTCRQLVSTGTYWWP